MTSVAEGTGSAVEAAETAGGPASCFATSCRRGHPEPVTTTRSEESANEMWRMLMTGKKT